MPFKSFSVQVCGCTFYFIAYPGPGWPIQPKLLRMPKYILFLKKPVGQTVSASVSFNCFVMSRNYYELDTTVSNGINVSAMLSNGLRLMYSLGPRGMER